MVTCPLSCGIGADGGLNNYTWCVDGGGCVCQQAPVMDQAVKLACNSTGHPIVGGWVPWFCGAAWPASVPTCEDTGILYGNNPIWCCL